MLPKAARLRHSADFAQAVRHGRSAGRPSLVVHLWQPAEAEQPDVAATDDAVDGQRRAVTGSGAKVGFIVSKRVGTAVRRHQVSRRLRHQMAARLERLPARSMVVVRARAGAAESSSAELGRDLDRALDRLSLARASGAAR